MWNQQRAAEVNFISNGLKTMKDKLLACMIYLMSTTQDCKLNYKCYC